MTRYQVMADGVPSATFGTRAEALAYIKVEKVSDRNAAWRTGAEYRIREVE